MGSIARSTAALTADCGMPVVILLLLGLLGLQLGIMMMLNKLVFLGLGIMLL